MAPRRRAAPAAPPGSGGRAAPAASPGSEGRAAPAAPPGPAGTDDLFRLLADPTRRRILDLLAERGTRTVGELAAEFPGLVASGISKHLMALRGAGLVAATRDGRQRRYRLDPEAMSTALLPWLVKYAPYWSDALERLRALAEADRERGR